jgi:hypothetical protein
MLWKMSRETRESAKIMLRLTRFSVPLIPNTRVVQLCRDCRIFLAFADQNRP